MQPLGVVVVQAVMGERREGTARRRGMHDALQQAATVVAVVRLADVRIVGESLDQLQAAVRVALDRGLFIGHGVSVRLV